MTTELAYNGDTKIRISLKVIRTGYSDPNKRVEVWAKDYFSTVGDDEALSEHMGSQEFGIDDLSGLSLGEFHRRIGRLKKRTEAKGDFQAAQIPQMLVDDWAIPTNTDALINKHPAEVEIVVTVVP